MLLYGAGPLVICSDCYDNANIYSRTREYCQYSYLGEDDQLDRALPAMKDAIADSSHLERTGLGNLMHSNHTAADKCVKGEKSVKSPFSFFSFKLKY